MATAVETSSQPTTPKAPASLFAASLFAAVYVAAAVVIVFYLLPSLWAQSVAPILGAGSFLDGGLKLVAQLAAATGLVVVGQGLAGANPVKGLRGGIFLIISFACAIFFITRSVGLSVEATSSGTIVTGVVGAILVFFSLRLLAGARGRRWMVGLEDAGWFHTKTYKAALGQKARRLTILGFLLVGGSGAYSLLSTASLPETWALRIPFTETTVTLLTSAKYSIPLILIGLTLWLAWRAVNMPSFAEFLIATEAEMNKVSWSTRKRLGQDTVVVLVTTIFMALFLLVVDLFWGWLLSSKYIGVLPERGQNKDKGGAQQELRY